MSRIHQGTENRSIPIPPIPSLAKQLPNLVGIDTTLPTEEYGRRAAQAEGRGDVAEAERWYWAGVKVAAARDNREYIQKNLKSLLHWATIHEITQRQLELSHELIGIMENRGHEDDVAEVLFGLACLQIRLGKPELAKLALERALGNWRWKNNWVAIANAYTHIGNTQLGRGDFSAALKAYHEAKQLRETQPTWNPDHRSWRDDTVLARSFGDYAGLALSIGQRDEAERYYREIIRLLQKLLPSTDGTRQSILGNQIHGAYLAIADMHVAQGDLLRAREVVREAEQFAGVSRSVSQSSFAQWGGTDERLGQILFRQGDFAGAEKAFRAEIERWEPVPVIGTRGVSRLKLELAQALSRQGKHSEALAKVGEVQRFMESSDMPAYLLLIRLEHVAIARRAGETTRATRLLTEARQGAELYPNLIERIGLLRRVGDEYAALGDKAKAEEAYRAAMALFESLLPRILDPTEAASFTVAQATGIYHTLATYRHSQGDTDQVLVLLERGKGQVLAQSIARTYPDLSKLLTGEDAQRLRKAAHDLTAAGFQIRTTIVDDTVSGAHQKALESWPEANRRYIEVRNLMLARYPLYRSVQAPQPLTASELKQLAFQAPDTLFIEWSVAEESTLCCTLSAKAGVQVRSLPLGKRHWQERVAAWRSAILAESIKERQVEPKLASELGRSLLPALPPNIRRLVLIADGPLQSLPFAALRLPDGRRLIEHCALRQTFSLSALTWEPREKSAPASQRAYCIASVSSPLKTEEVAVVRGTSGRALKPLRFADREVEQVARVLGAGKPLMGAAATEAAIRAALKESRIIHLAAHGVLLPDNSLYSWLLLSGSGSQDEDGRLEAREIAEMRLRAELAVLSACDTALADNSGIQGFAWAFRAAGCPAIAATLWKIDDSATAALMETFYRGLRAGRPKDEALCLAQRSLLKGRVSTWAGWVLFGATSPLTVPRSLPA